MEQLAAIIFALLALVVAVFHVALVLGAPWGEFTLGGRWRGVLPARVRFIPLLSVALLAVFAAVIAARAGLAFEAVQSVSKPLAWVVVGYCAVGSIANAITPSRRERMVWLPIVVLMCVLGTIVAAA